jgi:ABC-type Fe3+/spermidine/putrescine transport system ATPase subunit
MQMTDLQAKITRSIPQLSAQDLMQVAALIETLASQRNVIHRDEPLPELRQQWLERLRRDRAQLSTNSDQQTVLEMRQEERY